MPEHAKEENKKNNRFLSWVTCHPLIKLIALVLAILIWFYVQGELYNTY